MPDAPEPLHRFFTHVETTPAWVDWKRIRSGRRLIQRGGLDTIFLARDVPFLGGFAASGVNRTLLLTKTGQNGQSGDAQRFAETMQWALSVIGDDGLLPQGPGYGSTLHVRLIHAFVRRHVSGLPQWQADEWGVPVNQTDMAATILGAIYVPAVLSTALGVIATPRELEDVAHLTRYVGWLMGIEEQNLPTSFRDAMLRLYHYLMSLHHPDETSRAMAVPMANDPLQWNYRRFTAIRRRIAWGATSLDHHRIYRSSANAEAGAPDLHAAVVPDAQNPRQSVADNHKLRRARRAQSSSARGSAPTT